jgi:hypothetical protein
MGVERLDWLSFLNSPPKCKLLLFLTVFPVSVAIWRFASLSYNGDRLDEETSFG